jgi:hypothetical protein
MVIPFPEMNPTFIQPIGQFSNFNPQFINAPILLGNRNYVGQSSYVIN